MSTYHTPVLLNETVDALNVRSGKKYIDATLGGGGHAEAIVKRGGVLLGIDSDGEAVEFAKEKLKVESSKFKAVQGNFNNIKGIAQENNFDNVDGVLFDLGVSSHQLDTPGRGFSYRFTGAPLDLRLDQKSGETAAQLVNRLRKDELYEIIARFGEEELAGRIAARIIRARKVTPIVTVDQLAEAVAAGSSGDAATLSRVFQALRIAVNDEIGSLKKGLTQAQELLVPGGRLVVISFHSLEDRVVKQFMRSRGWRLIATKPVSAGEEEVVHNRRARSSKMRVAEKIV